MSQSATAVANGAKFAADRANLRGRHKKPHGQNPPNDMKFIKADIVASPSRTKASFIIKSTHRRLAWAPGSSPNVGILTLFWLRPKSDVQPLISAPWEPTVRFSGSSRPVQSFHGRRSNVRSRPKLPFDDKNRRFFGGGASAAPSR